jgi:hypothetical protein
MSRIRDSRFFFAALPACIVLIVSGPSRSTLTVASTGEGCAKPIASPAGNPAYSSATNAQTVAASKFTGIDQFRLQLNGFVSLDCKLAGVSTTADRQDSIRQFVAWRSARPTMTYTN